MPRSHPQSGQQETRATEPRQQPDQQWQSRGESTERGMSVESPLSVAALVSRRARCVGVADASPFKRLESTHRLSNSLVTVPVSSLILSRARSCSPRDEFTETWACSVADSFDTRQIAHSSRIYTTATPLPGSARLAPLLLPSPASLALPSLAQLSLPRQAEETCCSTATSSGTTPVRFVRPRAKGPAAGELQTLASLELLRAVR